VVNKFTVSDAEDNILLVFLLNSIFFVNHTLLSLAEGASCCFPSLGFQAFPFDLKEPLMACGLTLLQHELQHVKKYFIFYLIFIIILNCYFCYIVLSRSIMTLKCFLRATASCILNYCAGLSNTDPQNPPHQIHLEVKIIAALSTVP